MIAAKKHAIEELPQFVRLFKERPNDSTIKFAFETDQGETEFLWGDLLDLSENGSEGLFLDPTDQPRRAIGERNDGANRFHC